LVFLYGGGGGNARSIAWLSRNALFEEQYESDLKAHPETATALGDYRYNDQLNDVSLSPPIASTSATSPF